MKPPHISVITVCLNGAEFIEQAIQSVLSQSYPLMEYIIIDGGSTDGTREIVHSYESRLDYWHSRPDRGVAHAFNCGLTQAQGDWILFLNADDLDYLISLVKEPLFATLDFFKLVNTIGSTYAELFPRISEERPDVFAKLMTMADQLDEAGEHFKKLGYPNR